MRVEQTQLEQKLDNQLTVKAGLFSLFCAYVAFKDQYYGEKPDMIGFSILLTAALLSGLYTTIKVAAVWEDRHLKLQ